MNRYRISGKLSFGDVVELGKLNAVVVKDPQPFTEKTFPDSSSNPTTKSLVTIDHDDPAPESQHVLREQPVDFSLEFDAPDGDAALEWGINEIEARADVLTWLTLNPVEVQGMMSCVEISPGKRKELESIHEGSAQPAPEVLSTEFFTNLMAGRTLRGKLSPKLLGSFRWFRKALEANLADHPEDEFICYWIALEMIATDFTEGKQRFMFCHICDTQFETCPNCGKSTATKAQVSDGIVNMFKKHLNWPKRRFRDLYGTRSKLMHGNKAISEEFRKELIERNGELRHALVTGYEVLLDFTVGSHPQALRLFFYSDPSPQLRTTFDLPPQEKE